MHICLKVEVNVEKSGKTRLRLTFNLNKKDKYMKYDHLADNVSMKVVSCAVFEA